MRSHRTLCRTGLQRSQRRANHGARSAEKEDIIVTHLSNAPSVSPTLPGPATAPRWAIDMKPASQGMRMSSSTICAAQLHRAMLTTARLAPAGRFELAVSVCAISNWPEPWSDDCSLVANLDGRDEHVARHSIAARAAVNAMNAYCTTVQKSPLMSDLACL